MKVAVVTHYYAPHVGGIETVAREQAHRLAERGWEVHVFTSRLRGDDDLEQDGAVVVHRYRALNWFESAFRVPVPVPSPRMMVDLRAADANVFLVHGHTYAPSFYAAAAARLTKTPLVLLQHSPWVDYPQPLAALEYVADHTLGRFLFTTARQTICVSEHTAIRQLDLGDNEDRSDLLGRRYHPILSDTPQGMSAESSRHNTASTRSPTRGGHARESLDVLGARGRGRSGDRWNGTRGKVVAEPGRRGQVNPVHGQG